MGVLLIVGLLQVSSELGSHSLEMTSGCPYLLKLALTSRSSGFKP